ncbi:MAG TPA: hypothetical protein VGO59_04835 [Verrucomicrobiae bacterium]|jgi:hypothetical protein
MLELIDRQPESNVREPEYARLLGYPPHHVLEGRARELAGWCRQWYAQNGRPWVYARQCGSLELQGERLILEGSVFSSKHLHNQFAAAGAHTAVLAAVSAGPECEEKTRQLWEEGKPDEYFFLEMYGSAVVEHLITAAGGRLCAWADLRGEAVLPHYSPGYSGWDVAEQLPLWNVLRRRGDSASAGSLEVMETGMLRPKKSLLAVFGLTRHLDRVRQYQNLVPCENCALPGCPYRRKPYVHFLPQIEDVRQLQSAGPKAPPASGLNHDAHYSVNARALRKWSEERLQLKILHDGAIEARFRYEGTTCSNLGRPLEFDYHIKLTAPEQGCRIIEAACVPAPGDTGHTSQCEYLANPAGLMRAIAEEKPLLGRPLNDVLAWERACSPSGCYCDSARRLHKWGMVLEVLHYALTRREKEATNSIYDETL